MQYKKLDPKTIKVWKITRFIGFMVSLLILITAIILYLFTSVIPTIHIFWAIGAICLYSLLAIFIYPAIEYRQWKYAITADKIYIEHGLFFLNTAIIPIVRIQHITFSRGPINRKFSLVALKIHTASGAFEIKGLHEDVAKEISENLNEKLHHRLKEGEKEGEK